MKKNFLILISLFFACSMSAQTVPKSTLKGWFMTGKRPTQQQFHNWMDSYIHKTDDSIMQVDVVGLVDTLAALRALAESGGDPAQGRNTAFGVVGSDLRLVDDGGTFDVPVSNIGLQSEVDGSITNEIQTISKSGDVVSLSLGGGNVDLSDISGSATIQELQAPNSFDSLNVVTNDGMKGATLETIAAKVNEVNANIAKTTIENRFKKTLLQPTGVLSVVNKRISWNVRDKNKAVVSITSDARLLAPTSLEPGGQYSLIIKQDSIGHRLTYDGSVYHLNDTISSGPYAVVTVMFSSPDGRNMFGSVSAKIPSDIDVILSDFQNELELAIIPAILENNWLEGLNQFPKHTVVNNFGSSFAVTKDRSKNSFDVYHSTSPPNSSHLWEVEREDGNVALNTAGAQAWTIRDSKYLTTFHTGNFHFDVWLKSAANGTTLPILAVANGSASDNGIRIRKNALNQIQVTIGDGDGTYAFDFTTTTTLTVADGWQRLQVVGDTVGTDSILIVLKGTTEGDVFTPVSITEMTNDFRPGYDNGGVAWNGWLTNMLLFNRRLTANEVNEIGAIDKTKIYYSQPAEIVGKPFSPQNIRGLEWSHDWSGIGGRLWQDDAKTTAVASNNDPVFRSESVLGNLKLKEFTAGATGTRPVWQSNVVKSLGALYFDSLDVFDLDGFSTLKQLSGDFTIIGACSPDTTSERAIISDALGQYMSVSTPRYGAFGGGGRIHTGQMHVRMKGSEYKDYNSAYEGLTARVPRTNDDWFVFALTKQDTLFTLNVNNVYQHTATKGDAEGVEFYHIGGSGSSAFKGHFAELHKYGRALSNRVRDSLVYSIAEKYAITANLKTDETFDEQRVEIWGGAGEDSDYVSFGEPFVLEAENKTQRDTGVWIGTVDAFHNGQVSPSNPSNKSGIYLVFFDEYGLIDTFRVFKDQLSDTTDARQSCSAAFWGRDSLLVMGTYAKYVPGDTTISGANGFQEFRQRFRWVNWRTKALGPIQNVNHPIYDSTDLYLTTDLLLIDPDTFYIAGYAAGFENYRADFCSTVNGGSTFTNIFTIDPAANNFQYVGMDGNSYTANSTFIDPEECQIIQMANGSYCYSIRIDPLLDNDLNELDPDSGTAEDDRGLYTYVSTDIDDWSSGVLTHGFLEGVSMPIIYDDNGYLYASQREDFTQYKTYLWRSIDFGKTWSQLGQVDSERATALGYEDMYGGYINLNGRGYVVKSSADRAFNGDNCDLSIFPFESIKKE